MAPIIKVKIGRVSKRRSYEEEALEETCEGLRMMVTRIEAFEAAQEIGQKKRFQKKNGYEGPRNWSEEEIAEEEWL